VDAPGSPDSSREGLPGYAQYFHDVFYYFTLYNTRNIKEVTMQSMKSITTFAVLAGVAFVLHFVWEMVHIPLYTGYEALGSGMSLTLLATLGDILYTLAAVLLVALFKQRLLWAHQPKPSDYVGLGVLGFCIALFVEYKALALHRWAYTAAMPLFAGVGLSPLLQMTLLLPLSVFGAQYILRKLRGGFLV